MCVCVYRLNTPDLFLPFPLHSVFFGISFILVIILSGFFISNIYIKWNASPIIISTSAKQMLTSNMPFPAITICNLNQALRSRVERIPR